MILLMYFLEPAVILNFSSSAGRVGSTEYIMYFDVFPMQGWLIKGW